MGLGKTLQTMCTFRGDVLVVCPTSVIANWVAELGKFRPDVQVNRYHGGENFWPRVRPRPG